MNYKDRKTNIPVLLLYNIDPCWELTEQQYASIGAEKLTNELQHEGHPVIHIPVFNESLCELLTKFNHNNYVVFNWCEELPGQNHSESKVAQILEEHHFTFTGSSSNVIALSWDKALTKNILMYKNIPTPTGCIINDNNLDSWNKFPAIVKLAFEHCSVGINEDAVVTNKNELKQHYTYIKEFYNQPVIVEDFLEGREFHVTVWGNGTIQTLPAAEFDFSSFTDIKQHICTYSSKFVPGSSHYENISVTIPAKLNQSQLDTLNAIAIEAYKALGCRDYARIDIREKNDMFYVIDVNPNPDFSPDTSSIYAGEVAGISYGAMASYIVNLAALRHPVFSKYIYN